MVVTGMREPVMGVRVTVPEPPEPLDTPGRWPDGSNGCGVVVVGGCSDVARGVIIAPLACIPAPPMAPIPAPCANPACEKIITAATEHAPSSVLLLWETTCVIFQSPRS